MRLRWLLSHPQDPLHSRSWNSHGSICRSRQGRESRLWRWLLLLLLLHCRGRVAHLTVTKSAQFCTRRKGNSTQVYGGRCRVFSGQYGRGLEGTDELYVVDAIKSIQKEEQQRAIQPRVPTARAQQPPGGPYESMGEADMAGRLARISADW